MSIKVLHGNLMVQISPLPDPSTIPSYGCTLIF